MKNKSTPPVILLNMAVDVINARENDVIISQYAQRVSDSGAVPMLIPSIEKEENIETLLDLADGVLLIGGRDYDALDAFLAKVAKLSVQSGVNFMFTVSTEADCLKPTTYATCNVQAV